MTSQLETLTLFNEETDFLDSFEPMVEGGDPAANESHTTYDVEPQLGEVAVAHVVKSDFELIA